MAKNRTPYQKVRVGAVREHKAQKNVEGVKCSGKRLAAGPRSGPQGTPIRTAPRAQHVGETTAPTLPTAWSDTKKSRTQANFRVVVVHSRSRLVVISWGTALVGQSLFHFKSIGIHQKVCTT